MKEVIRLEKSKQFEVAGGDILQALQVSETALIAVLIEIEHRHPGTLAFVVRLMALSADGWHFHAQASDPRRSLEVQVELASLLVDIDHSINHKEGSQ